MVSEERAQSFSLYPVKDSRGKCPDILPLLTFQREALYAPMHWWDETSATASGYLIPASACKES